MPGSCGSLSNVLRNVDALLIPLIPQRAVGVDLSKTMTFNVIQEGRASLFVAVAGSRNEVSKTAQTQCEVDYVAMEPALDDLAA